MLPVIEQQLTRLLPRTKKASATGLGEAKGILRADTSSAVAVQLAATRLLGPFSAWEPETIWVELSRQGVELPSVNRDKLMAAVALDLVPSFYWDAVVLEKTSLAFNDVTPQMDALEEARPEHLAWAVEEAEHIRRTYGEGPLDFDHEPKMYCAVVLHRAGLVMAPPQLKFCQEALDRLTKDPTLKERVVSAETYGKDHPFQETPLDIQLGLLTAIRQYVSDRGAQAARELSSLS